MGGVNSTVGFRSLNDPSGPGLAVSPGVDILILDAGGCNVECGGMCIVEWLAR